MGLYRTHWGHTEHIGVDAVHMGCRICTVHFGIFFLISKIEKDTFCHKNLNFLENFKINKLNIKNLNFIENFKISELDMGLLALKPRL